MNIMRRTDTGIPLGIAVLAAIVVTMVAGAWVWADRSVPRDVTVSYTFDAVREEWVKTEVATKVAENPDGTLPVPQNTLIINVSEDNPIKFILITETLVINGPTEPLFEIAGHDPALLGIGELNIGQLIFNRVDAKEFKADNNVDAVRVSLTNVVAEDSELDIDVHIENVIRVNRGTGSALYIGNSRGDIVERLRLLGDLGGEDSFATLDDLPPGIKEGGLRVDRIRILGPNAGTGHIEKLVVFRSSVDGAIEIRDVNIQDLILRNVSLENP